MVTAKTHTDYRVWWIPQVPMQPFRVEVSGPAEGKRLLATLAQYDLFCLEHRVRPDYSNAGGLEWKDPDTGEWEDWYDVETGFDIDQWEAPETADIEKALMYCAAVVAQVANCEEVEPNLLACAILYSGITVKDEDDEA